MYNSVNPRPVKRYKTKIYKEFTFIDLAIVMFFGAIPSILLAVYIDGMIMKFTIGFLPLMFSSFLVIKIPQLNTKVYFYFGRILSYLYKKRKYHKNQNDWLIPYKKIEEDGMIKLTDKKGISNYIKVIKVSGFNFLTLTEDESHHSIESYRNFIRNLSIQYSLLSVDMPIDLSNQKEYLNSLSVSNENILQISKNILNEIETSITSTEKVYYFFFYGSKQNLKNEEKIILDNLKSMNLSPSIPDEKEILKLLSNFYSNENEITSLKNLVSSNSKTKFEKINIKINDKYQAIYAVDQFHFESTIGWLYPLMQIPKTSFIMNVEKYDFLKAKRKMDSVVSDLRSRFQSTHRHSEQSSVEHEYALMDELSKQVHQNSEIINSTYSFIIVKASSRKELFERRKEIRQIAGVNNIKINYLSYLQFEAFDAALPKIGNYIKKITSIELPSSSQANSFPFFQDYLNDEEGIYLGYSQLGSNIFFNPWKLTSLRKNHNITVLGASGGGKSTLLKKIAKDNFIKGVKVISIDPQRENKKLVESLGGKWINLGSDNGKDMPKFKINPLQFFQEDESQGALGPHLQFLEGFFKTLFPEITEVQYGELRNILIKLYSDILGLKKHFKSKDFPILKQLHSYVHKEFTKAKNNPNENYRLINLYALETYFQAFSIEDSPESNLWDGHTNFDISSEKFYVFDIQTLNSSQNTRLINAQMHLMLKFIYSEIIKNKVINLKFKKEEKVLLIVDEAHLLINEKQPAGLQFLYEMSKTVRKFSASLMIATQNIADLLGRSENVRALTSAIINNTQYSFYFQLNPDDLNSLQIVNESSNHKFSEDEKDYIVGSKKGDCLLSLSPMDRKMMHIDVSSEELSIWKSTGEA